MLFRKPDLRAPYRREFIKLIAETGGAPSDELSANADDLLVGQLAFRCTTELISMNACTWRDINFKSTIQATSFVLMLCDAWSQLMGKEMYLSTIAAASLITSATSGQISPAKAEDARRATAALMDLAGADMNAISKAYPMLRDNIGRAANCLVAHPEQRERALELLQEGFRLTMTTPR